MKVIQQQYSTFLFFFLCSSFAKNHHFARSNEKGKEKSRRILRYIYISFVGLFSRARRNAFETGGGSKLDFVASTILFPFQLPAAIMGRALVTVNHRDRRCDKWIINREEEGFDLRSSIFVRSKSISTISIENLSIFSTRFPFLSVSLSLPSLHPRKIVAITRALVESAFQLIPHQASPSDRNEYPVIEPGFPRHTDSNRPRNNWR